MARQEKQKHKLLALARIFESETDERHRLTVPQLAEKLAAQGIPCERKSIYTDIEALRQMGYDILLQRGRGGGYWLGSRTFELAELKLLVDAVQSCRFIPRDKTGDLIAKLEQLASRYDAAQLQRQVYVAGRPRSQNPAVLYTIDALHEAINTHRQVSFHYANGRDHTVSPWQMAWNDGSYYLIAYQDYDTPAGIRHYRVDRMSQVQVLQDRPCRGKELLREAMLDRFGRDLILFKEPDGGFHFTTPVCVSDPFLGWVCGFGGKVTVTAPAEVRARLAALGQKLRETY